MFCNAKSGPADQDLRLKILDLAIRAHPSHGKSAAALDLAKEYNDFVMGEYSLTQDEFEETIEKAKALVENLEKAKRLSRDLAE